MSKELKALNDLINFIGSGEIANTHELCEYVAKRKDTIETALKEAQKDKEMLNVFTNALTIERDIPPELEIKESEKGTSYIFREAVKIHENIIEEKIKKALRKWVLKNAFPKELKALEIIKDKEVNVFIFLHSGDLETYNDMVEENRKFTQEEYDLLKEVLL